MLKEQFLKYKDDFDDCKKWASNIKTWYKLIPNLLTVSRPIGIIPANILFFTGNIVPAFILSGVLLLTDLFDGKLARKWNVTSKLGKPIVIHTRDAAVDTIEILKKYPVQKTGIFHCCPLNQELIKEGLKLGYYISFSGNITFKNAKSEPCVSLVPMDRILIETDSPYLSPEPFRGKRNDSRNVKLVAQKIADIKGVTIEEVAQKTYENAKRVYQI